MTYHFRLCSRLTPLGKYVLIVKTPHLFCKKRERLEYEKGPQVSSIWNQNWRPDSRNGADRKVQVSTICGSGWVHPRQYGRQDTIYSLPQMVLIARALWQIGAKSFRFRDTLPVV